MQATRRELGLEAVPNVSFPRGLKALAAFGSRRYAVIDVGTNSVKFHVGERAADGTWRTVVDRADVTRLGEGLDESGKLGAEPIARTLDAIAGMVEEARNLGVEEIAAVGTAGLRIASNSADLVDAVRDRSGIEIEVISGEEESRLAYLAVESGLGIAPGSLVVFDTGGGSSQFTFGKAGRVEERFSVNVGAVRLTERFGLDGAVSEETLAEALDAIAGELAALDGRPPPDAVVGMGGAVTNLAAVKHDLADYDPEVVQGTELDRAEIERQVALYRTRDAEGAPRDRRPPASQSGSHPRGRVRGPDSVEEARQRLVHRQRPRPAARRSRRTIRTLKEGAEMATSTNHGRSSSCRARSSLPSSG